jgi:hypothetical protein
MTCSSLLLSPSRRRRVPQRRRCVGTSTARTSSRPTPSRRVHANGDEASTLVDQLRRRWRAECGTQTHGGGSEIPACGTHGATRAGRVRRRPRDECDASSGHCGRSRGPHGAVLGVQYAAGHERPPSSASELPFLLYRHHRQLPEPSAVPHDELAIVGAALDFTDFVSHCGGHGAAAGGGKAASPRPKRCWISWSGCCSR